jgi:hypothetical protein
MEFPYKPLALYSILEVASVMTFVYSILIFKRVYRLFRSSEPVLTAQTMYLTLSLLMLVVAILTYIVSYIINYISQKEQWTLHHIVDVVGEMATIIHLFLIIGTILFDLNKWGIFILSSEAIQR